MKLVIDTTAEQDDALASLNILSNGDLDVPQEEFATSVVNDFLDSLVVKTKQTGLDAAQTKLAAVVAQLTPTDITEIQAIAEKYATGTDRVGSKLRS